MGIIKWFWKHKILSALFFIVLISFLYIFLSGNQNQNTNITPLPTPTGLLQPTTLSLLGFNPQSGNVEMGGTKTAISLFFNAPVDPNSVVVESSPQMTFKVGVLEDNLNRIVLTPATNWVTGRKYTIKILKGVKSADGISTLNKEIDITYGILNVPPITKME